MLCVKEKSEKSKWNRGKPPLKPMKRGAEGRIFYFCESFMKIKIRTEKKEYTIPLPDKKRVKAGVEACKTAISDGAEQLKHDVKAVRDRDPAATSDVEVLALYSGIHATLAYRAAHALSKKGMTFPARVISQGTKMVTGIEIHPGATIGKDLFIDHGSGVVIGETAVIGDGCTIYQGVTLGGTGKDVGKRHPTLGNNVMVGAGAKVLGPVNIGSNTKIAAGAVVLSDIPDNCTAVGIPARIVKRDNVRVETDLDQIHIPDPVEREFAKLREEIEALKQAQSSLKNDDIGR
jgi:serine O-acetyltransferase